MTGVIGALDPRYRQAVDDAQRRFGFSIDEVLLPGHWRVWQFPDGQVSVTINAQGFRALALLSPVPSAVYDIEEVVAEMAARGMDYVSLPGDRHA